MVDGARFVATTGLNVVGGNVTMCPPTVIRVMSGTGSSGCDMACEIAAAVEIIMEGRAKSAPARGANRAAPRRGRRERDGIGGGSQVPADVPLYRVVIEQLRADMATGTLSVGAPLPSEKDLCARFDVSRITVRRAVDELAREGRIHRQAGRVSRVAAHRLVQSIAAFEDPLDMRRLVDATAIRLLSFQWLVIEGQVGRALQVEDGDQVLSITRLRVQDDGPLFHTAIYLPQRIGATLNRKALDGSALYDLLAETGHIPKVIERQMSAAPCPKSLARHLGLKSGAPTLRIERLSRDADGRPLHLLIGHWRWDRYCIRLRSDSSNPGVQLVFDQTDLESPNWSATELALTENV